MTQQQADAFRAKCEELPNVSLAGAPNYEATLWQSSVMISDISSIMPEFFLTGKPLIFCDTNMHLKLAAPTLRMLEGCYIVHNDQELFDCLRMPTLTNKQKSSGCFLKHPESFVICADPF